MSVLHCGLRKSAGASHRIDAQALAALKKLKKTPELNFISMALHGKKQGFDIVFNQSLKNPGASDVMYVKTATDITGPVVKELNATQAAQ